MDDIVHDIHQHQKLDCPTNEGVYSCNGTTPLGMEYICDPLPVLGSTLRKLVVIVVSSSSSSSPTVLPIIMEYAAVITARINLASLEYRAAGGGVSDKLSDVLGILELALEDCQKEDWKAYVPSLVHAYNATKPDSIGYAPFYLMFGRHPRLPIDIAMGTDMEKEEEERMASEYVEELRKKLEWAYEVATKESRKASSGQKGQYDKRIRGTAVEIGDRVLVKNVTKRGKCQLANRFEDEIYVVKEQPNKDIPVFVVEQEVGPGKRRILCHPMVLMIVFRGLGKTLKKKFLRRSKIKA